MEENKWGTSVGNTLPQVSSPRLTGTQHWGVMPPQYYTAQPEAREEKQLQIPSTQAVRTALIFRKKKQKQNQRHKQLISAFCLCDWRDSAKQNFVIRTRCIYIFAIISFIVSRNTVYCLACLGVIWNITHAINSAPFLLAHTVFSSATPYHTTGKRVTPKTATLLLESHLTTSVEFTIAGIYFWEELPFYQPTLYCSDQRAGKQDLILQHNLAPILYSTAAGEMAPAWQKPQSCNTHNWQSRTQRSWGTWTNWGIMSICLHTLSAAALKPSSW